MRSRTYAWSSFLARLGAVCFCLVSLVLAGGPNNVGSAGNVQRWNPDNPATFPVRFILDNGRLGPLSKEEAADLVRQSFQKWVNVGSSLVDFLELGFLTTDLTGAPVPQPGMTNYLAFFNGQMRPENPIVFDNDGSIIEDVFGVGSNNTVLGFVGVRFVDAETGDFQSAWAVLNGVKANTVGSFPQVVTHEIGHLIGLDHTQVNANVAFSGPFTETQFVPLMFPFLISGSSGEPLRDDVAWVSWLYPEDNFAATTGTISGQVRRRSGAFFGGANVVAVQAIQDPDLTLTESREEAVFSVVSDFLRLEDGSYELPGLAPGDYLVFIEPLDDRFVGGSGVGPFDGRFTGFEKDYYNGANESGSDADDPSERVVISVAAGQRVENIDLISNDPVNRLDLLTDDSDILFEFPEGFSFPFFGGVYQQVSVNSDGNLTFGIGDSNSGPRDESRFLSGPPRIAPLFSDLNPETGGSIKATSSNGQVTFSWEDVPEFSPSENRPGNRFSVTLFSNGDVLFHYDLVDVSADPDDLQAIVGISPGSVAEAGSSDLSSFGGETDILGAPVYEVFQASSFDLTGQDILFQAAESELYFPFYRGDADNFSGFAITNFSDGDVVVDVEGRDDDGDLPSDFVTNPTSQRIDSQNQLARLGSELFGVGFDVARDGWIRLTSSGADVASFFQFGNGLSGELTKMDGSVALTGQSQVLFFTRLFDGPNTFPAFGLTGPQDAQTFLSIANPNDVPITLDMTLYNNVGQTIAQKTIQLPAFGRVFGSVVALFDSLAPNTRIDNGYVRVNVTTGPGAVGFELIELEDTIMGLNASFGTEQVSLYSAQLANGTDQTGRSIFTNLKLVNTSNNDTRTVTLTALADDGQEITTVPPFGLLPNQSVQVDASAAFGLGTPTSIPLTTLVRSGSMWTVETALSGTSSSVTPATWIREYPT